MRKENCNYNKEEKEINTFRPVLKYRFEGEQIPKYSKKGDSAIDLHAYQYKTVKNGELSIFKNFSEEGYTILPLERILVSTGLYIQYEQGIDATIRPRSGLSLKYGIVAQLGTIHNNYDGDHGIILINMSNEPYTIHKGDRLAQLRFSRPIKPILQRVNSINKTERDGQGFGSSGRD